VILWERRSGGDPTDNLRNDIAMSNETRGTMKKVGRRGVGSEARAGLRRGARGFHRQNISPPCGEPSGTGTEEEEGGLVNGVSESKENRE